MNSVYDQLLVREHLAKAQAATENSGADAEQLTKEIKDLLQEKNAVLIAHYYTSPEIQALAEATGGFIGDSLEMARFGAKHSAQTLVIAGVRFMGETAKILSPQKQVLMPTLEATCSLDIGCDPVEFAEFRAKHPEKTVVVYANTSAAVKAQADWVVTSSIALKVVSKLHAEGKSILWAPDKHLGDYINRETGADMLLWDGACLVHEEFKAKGINDLKKLHPEAAVLVHPESPRSVVEVADVVGSTSQLLKAAGELEQNTFIVATDKGIFYKMQQQNPEKTFIEAPTAGNGATCRSCANCPWMAMNSLERMANSLRTGSDEVQVEPELIQQALIPLDKMLNFPTN